MRTLTVLALALLWHAGHAEKPKADGKDKVPRGWIGDYQEARRAAKESGKPILAVFH